MPSIRHDPHSLSLLDFARLRSNIAGYCVSDEGRRILERSLPCQDALLLTKAKEEVTRLARRIEESEPPDASFPDIESAVTRLQVQGVVLEIGELYALGLWAKDYERLFAWAKARGSVDPIPDALKPYDPELLAASWDEIRLEVILFSAPVLTDVYKIIFDILTPEGELKDLPELQRIKATIQRTERDILRLTEQFKTDPELKTCLQSGEPTQRDGRTVLAVKANFRGRIKGIVHEVSSTGQTVFIEPGPIVERNNALVRLNADLRAEIAKILRKTAEKLNPYSTSLRVARSHLGLFDAMLARAMQLRRESLVLAGQRTTGLTLWRARHPLLGTKAVPIDIDIPDETRTLIITGPNTGGKTVSLKTLGLFALLNQLAGGLRVAEGSSMPVFDAVMADIGDEQSIDQSLSTFSGHMKVVSLIVAGATDRSLVLLDELGAGTDPEEGCALAMGLLDFFIERRALAIVTTHHGILKNYGYTRTGCLNASMEFDATRFAPTYRIVMGLPGESRALEIAEKTGLPSDIVATARRYLDEERTDVGELISELTEKRRDLEKLRREQEQKLKETAEDRRRLDLASLRVRQKEHELKKQGLGDLKSLLQESRKTLENLVRELREEGVSTEKTKDVKAFLSNLADSVGERYAALETEAEFLSRQEEGKRDRERAQHDHSKNEASAAAGKVREGDAVIVKSTGKTGTAVRKTSSKRWIVEVGSVRITVAETDLSLVLSSDAPKPTYDVELAQREPGETGSRARFELDLRGFRLAEAIVAVERQIDAANLQGLALFSLVHGTGEGILGKGIHEYLKRNPSVLDYHFARPEEGGFGKTIVRLKS